MGPGESRKNAASDENNLLTRREASLCLIGLAGTLGIAMPASVAPAQVAVALELYNPLLPHFARRRVRFGNRSITSRFYHSPGRSREEIDFDGRTLTIIFDLELRAAWLFGSKQKLAIETPLGRARNMFTVIPDDITEFRHVGDGEIAGAPCRIFMYRATTGSGRLWATREGVLFKAEGIVQDRAGAPVEFGLQLTVLEVGLQEESLFRLPEGVETMAIGGASLHGFNLRRLLNQFPIR